MRFFLSPLSDNTKLELFFYWRVIYAGATINVTCLTYPQIPQSERRRLGPQRSGRIRVRGMMGSKEEGKLDRRMRRSSHCVTLKSYRHKQTNNNNEKHKVKSSGYSSLCGCFIEYFDICWREFVASSIECTVRTR